MGIGASTRDAGVTIGGRESFPTPFAKRFFQPWLELRDDGKQVPTVLVMRDDAEYIRDRIADYEQTTAYAKYLIRRLVYAYENSHSDHFLALLEDARILAEEP